MRRLNLRYILLKEDIVHEPAYNMTSQDMTLLNPRGRTAVHNQAGVDKVFEFAPSFPVSPTT